VTLNKDREKAQYNKAQALNLIDELNKPISYILNKGREKAQYSKAQVLQMRGNSDSRLYQTPDDANRINAGGFVWENGKVGYFIPFQHRELGYDFMCPPFGGGQKDGKGLRFVQIHKDNKPFVYPQSNDIVFSGFGEYVLENWGKDLSNLCSEYTNRKYNERIEQWRKDNYPAKMDKQTALQLLIDLQKAERDQWNKATMAEFFTAIDNKKLNQCMDEYFNWFDNRIQIDNNKEEKDLVNFIKTGTISNKWVNGKAGNFNDFDNNCLYRFCETDVNCNSYLLKEQEQRELPVSVCGFMAWLIKHWGTDTQTIYSGYLQAKISQYKNDHKNDADVFKRNLEREFYDQYKAKEEQWVKQSEAIFEFISDAEKRRIKDYVKNYFEYVNTQIPAEQPNNQNTEKPQRTIDAEKLNPYFKSTFKGTGNSNINYFEWLIGHLKTERTPKAFAQIALMIYESKTALNNTKPNTFKGWYSVFCECVGCEQKTYKKNQLKDPPEQITKTFNYL
jgi:hypothetical protein